MLMLMLSKQTHKFPNYEMTRMLLSKYHFQTGENMIAIKIQMIICKNIFISLIKELVKLSSYNHVENS